MKKIKSVLLLAAASLSTVALASCQKGDGKEHLSLSRDQEISHKLFEAAKSDNLLKNHENYAYTWDEPTMESTAKEYHYVEEGAYYREWSSGTYRLDFIDERIVISTEWTDPTPFSVGANINDELTQIKPYTVEDEIDFYDPETETIKDIYIQDGLLHFVTEYKEDLAKDWADYYGVDLGKNGKFYSEYVAYADSYEPKEFTISFEKDGEKKVLFIQQMEYEVETPAQYYILAAYYYRESRSFTHIVFHVNPGSENGFDVEYDVPTYTEVTYYHDGEMGKEGGYVYFDDLECTTLTRWDRASTFEKYFFTNPSQELINKFQDCYNNLPPLEE